MAKVLTIEDDETTAREIVLELAGHGFQVDHVADGPQGLRLAMSGAYDAITLDRMLPGMDGLTIASALKAHGVDTPILLISALTEVDDYLTKPFALDEMAARVEVLIRRRAADASRLLLRQGDLELDLVSHTARRGGRDLRLFPKEMKLLEMFLRNPGQILTRTMIFEAVWGYYFDPSANLIDVHLSRLRRKLETLGAAPLIQTVRASGYALRAQA